MAVYSLKTVQHIPVSLEKAWDFFSSPANLQAITPEDLHFRIISEHHGHRMYAGQVIEYKVRPLWGIGLYWMTEITHVQEGVYFIDEQRYGPYNLWHHQHHFKAVDGGVEMTDIVHYKLPFGFLGRLVHPWIVKRKLENIFAYRRQKVEDLFGKWDSNKKG